MLLKQRSRKWLDEFCTTQDSVGRYARCVSKRQHVDGLTATAPILAAGAGTGAAAAAAAAGAAVACWGAGAAAAPSAPPSAGCHRAKSGLAEPAMKSCAACPPPRQPAMSSRAAAEYCCTVKGGGPAAPHTRQNSSLSPPPLWPSSALRGLSLGMFLGHRHQNSTPRSQACSTKEHHRTTFTARFSFVPCSPLTERKMYYRCPGVTAGYTHGWEGCGWAGRGAQQRGCH